MDAEAQRASGLRGAPRSAPRSPVPVQIARAGMPTTRPEVLSEGPAFGLAMPAWPQCLAGLAWHCRRISFPLAQFLWVGKE